MGSSPWASQAGADTKPAEPDYVLQHTASTRITYLHMRTTYIHLVRSRPCPFPCGHSVQAAVRRQQGSPPAREYSTRGALVPTPARRQHSPPPQTPRTHRHACVHAKHFDLAARYPAGALQLRSRPGAPRSGLLPRCTSSAQRHHLAPPPPTQLHPPTSSRKTAFRLNSSITTHANCAAHLPRWSQTG